MPPLRFDGNGGDKRRPCDSGKHRFRSRCPMPQVIAVQRDLSAIARMQADAFRQRMSSQGTLVVNLMSSPGSGKTSLLEAMGRRWGKPGRLAVLVGDIATDRDAQRLAPLVPVVQLTTGGACHLELSLVERG